MGVSIRRAGGAALVLAAVLLPLRSARHDREAFVRIERNTRLDTLMYGSRTAAYWWSALSERDSALRALATVRPTATPPIVVSGFPPGATDPAISAITRQLWSRIGAIDSSFRGMVLAYNNDPYRTYGYGGALIIQAPDENACVAIAAGSPAGAGGMRVHELQLDAGLAPCALLAAFGAPGRTVGSWLKAAHFSPAQSNDWLLRSAFFRSTNGPWARWSPARTNWATENLPLQHAFDGLLTGWTTPPPYEYGSFGLRCLNGDQQACATGVLQPSFVADDSSAEAASLTLPSWMGVPNTVTLQTLRPLSPTYVSALISNFGRERFRKFWKSGQPFETAFRSAFGESLGAWTARWAQQEWEGTYESKFRAADIAIGVTLEPSWSLLLALWSGASLLLAFWVAKRRTA